MPVHLLPPRPPRAGQVPPRDVDGPTSARMMQLCRRQNALLVQEIDDPLLPRDVVVRPDAQVTIGVAPDGIHDQTLSHYGARAADCELCQMLEVPIRRLAVGGCLVHLHRRDDDPVRKRYTPQLEWAEEHRLPGRLLVSHAKSLSNIYSAARAVG